MEGFGKMKRSDINFACPSFLTAYFLIICLISYTFVWEIVCGRSGPTSTMVEMCSLIEYFIGGGFLFSLLLAMYEEIVKGEHRVIQIIAIIIIGNFISLLIAKFLLLGLVSAVIVGIIIAITGGELAAIVLYFLLFTSTGGAVLGVLFVIGGLLSSSFVW